LQAQKRINSKQFFIDEQPVKATLITDISAVINQKMKPRPMKAVFKYSAPDSSVITQNIIINARGQFRRSECYMPPLKLDFHTDTTSPLYSLGSLKLVGPCKFTNNNEELLLKEYLVYKMYNLLTEKSFRVRLMELTYEDSRGKRKSLTKYNFFIEDVDAMAKRNGCKEYENDKILTEQTNRKQMTLVALFQYMIGNTDWAVPKNHNIRLIRSKKDTLTPAYAVPYDFDYSGLVDAYYAIPTAQLGIEKVTERVYRGFPRTLEELEETIMLFNQQKENIYSLILNFDLLSEKTRKNMTSYIDIFYKQINDKRNVKTIFIDKARQF
jgi:hypothetical protein